MSPPDDDPILDEDLLLGEDLILGGAPVTPAIIPKRVVDDRLAISITRADGSVKRWGPGEPDGADVPDDLSFSTSIPGGFKDCTCSLLRRVDLDYNDQGLFDNVRAYGPGNQTAWEGRMVQFPRDHGDSYGIQPAAVGHAAHLKDDPSFREIYVDIELSKWRDASVAFKLALSGFGFGTTGPSVVTDSTSAALSTAVSDTWAVGARANSGGWYDAAGIPIGSLYYAWKRDPTTVNNADANWTWDAELSLDDTASSTDVSGNLRAAGPGTGTVTATTATRKFALVQLYYAAAGGVAGTNYPIFWTRLAVYGNHGLTKQGTASATESQGFYASDIIADIVGRAAPLLDYSTGTDGSIEPTSFVIPHCEFRSPVTAEDAISAVNAYHLYDWGVYDNQEFFYRQPDPDRLTWQARLSEGAKLSLEGDTAEQVFNGVFVTYTDPSGATKTVGPPGAIADATDSTLADTTDTNPVNSHGIPKRWGRLDLSLTTTQAGAIQLGYTWLQERALAARRGQITLTGTVTHPTEGEVPVWRVRAGDWITIADHPSSAPRKIIETTYSHGSRSVTLSVDNTAAKVEAILERLGLFNIGRF